MSISVHIQPQGFNAFPNNQMNLSKPQLEVNKSEGVFKVPLPIRPTTQIKNLCNAYKLKQMAVVQEKRAQYENFLKLAAIKNAIIQHQKRIMIDQMRQFRAETQTRNTQIFLSRMRYYSQLPQFSKCIFKIPNSINGWDIQPMTIEQIDKFIFDNNLIANKKTEESIEHVEIENEGSSTDESDSIANSDEQIKERLVKEVLFKIPTGYYEQSDISSIESVNQQESEEILEVDSDSKIGQLSKSNRSKLILKYKSKIYARRIRCPISKKFNGRSKVASQKLRVNGKFVKAAAL